MDRYDRVDKLGEGAYGVVYKARDNVSKQFVAMKKIRLETEDDGIPSTTLREISVLRQLKHPNIVVLQNVLHETKRMYLIFEYVDQDLKKYMECCADNLSQELIKSFTYQMLKGLEYCHMRGVMHRDLKPQNLLVSKNGILKLADFGLARSFVPPIRPLTHEVITLWYRAPEILLGVRSYALPVDLWSVGTIIAELANKKALLRGYSEIDQIFKTFQVLGTPTEESWPGVTGLQDWNSDFPAWPTLNLAKFMPNLSSDGVDIVERLIQLDPTKRLTAAQALQHPFLQNMEQMVC